MNNSKTHTIKSIAYTFVVLGMIFFSSSCNKKGCTDSSACNYSYEATKDDGTCNYGCGSSSSSSSSGGTSSGGTSSGRVTFYTQSDLGCGTIYVSISGQSSKSITSYYSSGISGCDKSGCANFTLTPGTYTYTASCSGYNWGPTSFTVTSNGCLKYELY